MSVLDKKVAPSSGIASQILGGTVVPAQSLTNSRWLMRQMKTGIYAEQVQVYCRSYTATGTIDFGIVPVGTCETAVSLGIAATASRLKITAALIGVSSTPDTNTGLPTIVHKAITDNIAWSTAYTINTAAASGQFWGAFRIQMDSLGAVTMIAVTSDQAHVTEAAALMTVPPAQVGQINLGTVTIRCATGAAFILNTTNLDAAGTTVNYNGAAAGYTSVLSSAVAPVALTLVTGAMSTTAANRRTATPGALLIGRYTTDGSFVATDLSATISFRPYPMDGES